MTNSVISSIPFIGGSGTLRDDILSTLTNEQPLSAKEIFLRVKRQQGRDVTYQAVHKTIKQLVEKKVLTKDKQKYNIAKEWVEQAKEYFKLIENAHGKNPSIKKVLKRLPETTIIHFTNFSDLCLFVANMFIEYRELKKEKISHYSLLRHIWWPLKFEFSMWQLLQKMDDDNVDNHTVVAQDTAFDRLIKKYYIMCNPKDKLIIGLPPSEKVDEDIMTRGNLVIQVHYSEKTKKELHEIFSGIRSLTDLFHLYFIHGKQEGPFNIDVTISENPAMTKLFREKVKSYFGEK